MHIIYRSGIQLYETIFKCKKSKNKEAHVEKLLWVIVFLRTKWSGN